MSRARWMAAVILASTGVVSLAADWPAFRGPTGQGVSTDKGFPVEWSQEKNVRWKIDMPSRGNESPIVVAGRVFVTSADAKGHERRLHCFDRKTGQSLWTKSVAYAVAEETHGTNPFGAATPVSNGACVVVWHGSAGVFCYDLEGNELWKRELGRAQHIWGYGSSPVIHDGRVLLNFGPGVEQFVVALDLKSGDVLWKHQEPGGINDRSGRMVGSWSTPVVTKIDGADQVLCSLPTRVVALDPKTGEVLWFCQGLSGQNGDLVYTSPVIGDGLAVAMGGYTGPAIAFKLGGRGDVTETHRLWHQTKGNPQRIGSGVIIGEHLFMANAGPGFIQCLEAATHKELWRDRGAGKDHWGSMVRAEDRLYVTNQDGTTLVFAPNSTKFEQLAVNSLGEPSNSTPAFSDGEIFLRTARRLYCLAKLTD